MKTVIHSLGLLVLLGATTLGAAAPMHVPDEVMEPGVEIPAAMADLAAVPVKTQKVTAATSAAAKKLAKHVARLAQANNKHIYVDTDKNIVSIYERHGLGEVVVLDVLGGALTVGGLAGMVANFGTDLGAALLGGLATLCGTGLLGAGFAAYENYLNPPRMCVIGPKGFGARGDFTPWEDVDQCVITKRYEQTGSVVYHYEPSIWTGYQATSYVTPPTTYTVETVKVKDHFGSTLFTRRDDALPMKPSEFQALVGNFKDYAAEQPEPVA